MDFIFNDGGREATGKTGKTGDCVTRAIAIASELPYNQIYNELFELAKDINSRKRKHKKNDVSPRNGVDKKVTKQYLKSLGWVWTPTMLIGQGCKVHVTKNEIPSGRVILQLSKHVTCVIDGVIYDTYDCSRDENRCVYGYWQPPSGE